MANQKFTINFACWKYEGSTGEGLEEKDKLCNEVETVREFTYPVDKVSVCERYKAAVTGITRYWLVAFGECVKLLYGKRFPPKLKGAVYNSYVRLPILYGSQAWCLKEGWIVTLGSTERSTGKTMCRG